MGFPRRTHDGQGADWAGDRNYRVAGAAVAADHFRHTSGTAGTSGRGHPGRGVVLLGAGISVFPPLQPNGGRFRFRRVANDAGRPGEWRYSAGDGSVPENTLDRIGAYGHRLSRYLRI